MEFIMTHKEVSAIEQRRLGASGIQVAALGLGTQQWGDKRWGNSITRQRAEGSVPTSTPWRKR
jgi:hypothetical protein